ncbi:GDP dissociation inhibitor family protein / Rab GTPase activator family protein [Prunus dulcis]|uniref:Guanosine nucleotide diphosphate dissociation inhibitor n=1 Tax=Prunus dulcis TaxID=3755 RepID=A0A4Y1RYZ5_PRUDU|nr:GDP dissociation inhibitor family protein / Rab GTPase activator family protein [Prunus dulcis]
MPLACFVAMDEEYDVIVLGTGLKECILSGLLSVDGLKVLHMDRNDYYGGASTSLNLTQLWKRLGEMTSLRKVWAQAESTILLPSFPFPLTVHDGNGGLVRVLIHTDAVDGSFVYNKKKIYKVPATDVEALKSPLMGLFEKRRARKFFIYVQDFEANDPKSHEGLDLNKVTARELYAESLARFEGGSPYIYPLYGLGELPQAFARLSAVYGGTYMLNKPECQVKFDDNGTLLVRKVGKVARAICIMSHPIPDTNDSHSVQVILPQKQLGRKSDMYLFCCSYAHNVAPKGKFIAFVSTEAETDDPQVELKSGIDLLGPLDEIFYDTYDRYVPLTTIKLTSYDATTHFESTVQDVLAMYTKITGKALDLSVDLSAASATAEE